MSDKPAGTNKKSSPESNAKAKSPATEAKGKSVGVQPNRARPTRAGGSNAKVQPLDENLPDVSKQTAGGITGAMVGGVVGGPVGAVVGGVVGAMVGNASAEGKRPLAKTVENIRAVAEKPARKVYARITKAIKGKKNSSAKPAAGGTPAKKAAAKKTAGAHKTAHDKPVR